ncbi:MAG: hypothetical protein NTV86_00730 [Planctomycetota bacterium]|nr:hypothetical protein [Planctomycetota bacterium]
MKREVLESRVVVKKALAAGLAATKQRRDALEREQARLKRERAKAKRRLTEIADELASLDLGLWKTARSALDALTGGSTVSLPKRQRGTGGGKPLESTPAMPYQHRENRFGTRTRSEIESDYEDVLAVLPGKGKPPVQYFEIRRRLIDRKATARHLAQLYGDLYRMTQRGFLAKTFMGGKAYYTRAK